ncbi:hypothetical protein VCHC50A2_1574A, partial [Vibrio cholerae HC-50A2]
MSKDISTVIQHLKVAFKHG